MTRTGKTADLRRASHGLVRGVGSPSGVGSSIQALTARDVLSQGRTPVAGCWWKNWASRVTLETAGMTCAGTIFRLDLDPDVFAENVSGR